MQQDATITWVKAQTLLAKGWVLKRAFWNDKDAVYEVDGELFQRAKLWEPLQDDKSADDWMVV